MRGLFPLVSAGVAKVLPPESIRWISFGHVEADESGSMNEWLALAPAAEVVQGMIGCMVSIGDLADRPPKAMADGETLDIGGHVVQWFDTPHVPHSWDAGLLYEKTTGTLFCSDLFTHLGNPPALTDGDIVGPAIAAEESFHFTSLTPSTGATMRRLAAQNLAEEHPSKLVKWLFYSHPPIRERVAAAQEFAVRSVRLYPNVESA